MLRDNNRRVLGLNDDDNDSSAQLQRQAALQFRAPRNRSYSVQSLNHARRATPFPIVLARSKTEESCIRRAELDAFQGKLGYKNCKN